MLLTLALTLALVYIANQVQRDPVRTYARYKACTHTYTRQLLDS